MTHRRSLHGNGNRSVKLTVHRAQSDTETCARVFFSQEGMKGFVLTEYEVKPLVETLENIVENATEYFFQNIGVRRQVESVTIVRLTSRDEVLLKLTHGKAQKLASSLRVSYPEYF